MVKFLSSLFGVNLSYFLHRGSWLSITQTFTALLALLTSVFLANALEESTYGAYRYMIALAGFFGALSLTGAGQAVFQTAAKNITSFFGIVINKSLIYSTPLVTVGLSAALYYYLQGELTLSMTCVLIAFFQPIITVFQSIIFYLQGRHEYKTASFIQMSKSLLGTVSLFIALFVTHNPLHLFAIFLGTKAAVNLIAYLLFKPEPVKLTTQDKEIHQRYLAYAKHNSIRNLIGVFANRLDAILVFQQLGAASLAIYSIGNILPEQIKGTVKNLSYVVLQKFTDINNTKKVVEALPKRTLQLGFMLVVVSLLYCFMAQIVYPILFPKYPDAIFISQIFALSFPAHAAILPNSVLRSEMKEDFLYRLQVIVAIGSTALLVVGTFTLGILGTALGRVVGRYLNLAINYYYARKI